MHRRKILSPRFFLSRLPSYPNRRHDFQALRQLRHVKIASSAARLPDEEFAIYT